MKEENLDEKVPVRAYTKADLAMLYIISYHPLQILAFSLQKVQIFLFVGGKAFKAHRDT